MGGGRERESEFIALKYGASGQRHKGKLLERALFFLRMER